MHVHTVCLDLSKTFLNVRMHACVCLYPYFCSCVYMDVCTREYMYIHERLSVCIYACHAHAYVNTCAKVTQVCIRVLSVCLCIYVC